MGNDKIDRVLTWTTDDVSDWLTENDLSQYVELLCGKHKIDGKSLLTLTESDLREPPLNLEIVGDIKRLMIGIWKLQKLNSESCYILLPGDISSSSDQSSCSNGFANHDSYDDDRQTTAASKKIENEWWKTGIAFLFAITISMINGLITLVVHDNVPDPKKYPPLPDILMDRVQYLPWAFRASEIITSMLSFTFLSLMFFHKHRSIVLRRIFAVGGTVYLLRCITMLITSLSIPGKHIQCHARSYNSFLEQLKGAFFIVKGAGMTIHGIRNCGDYIFSGHTASMTMLNFFIIEYTPRCVLIPLVTWILNFLGMFFILSAHEHYSIDIFIAFYITTCLFLYYHILANNRNLMQHDRSRMRFWFPLFSFFESNTEGVVPNEYEWPLPWPKSFKRCFNNKRISRSKDHKSLLLVCVD